MELTKEILLNNWFLLLATGGAFLLLFTSGTVVRRVMNIIYKKNLADLASANNGADNVAVPNVTEEKLARDRISTGLIIGKCENLIIYLMVLTGSYTALAIIFTAKTIIRKEDIAKNSMFFLAGTMINVTYSLLISILVKLLIVNVLSCQFG
jgi:hypothetical protein